MVRICNLLRILNIVLLMFLVELPAFVHAPL